MDKEVTNTRVWSFGHDENWIRFSQHSFNDENEYREYNNYFDLSGAKKLVAALQAEIEAYQRETGNIDTENNEASEMYRRIAELEKERDAANERANQSGMEIATLRPVAAFADMWRERAEEAEAEIHEAWEFYCMQFQGDSDGNSYAPEGSMKDFIEQDWQEIHKLVNVAHVEHKAREQAEVDARELYHAPLVARAEMQAWGNCAPLYFQKKWDLEGDLEKAQRILDKHSKYMVGAK